MTVIDFPNAGRVIFGEKADRNEKTGQDVIDGIPKNARNFVLVITASNEPGSVHVDYNCSLTAARFLTSVLDEHLNMVDESRATIELFNAIVEHDDD